MAIKAMLKFRQNTIGYFRYQSMAILINMYIILFLLSCLIVFKNIKTKSYHPLPPGPKPWPVFGCLFEMLRSKPMYKWIHKIMNEMNTDIAYFPLGRVNVIAVTSPELAREILKKQDLIFSSRPRSVALDMISNGYLSVLFSPYGDQWKKMKKILVSNLISPTMNGRVSSKILEEAGNLVYCVFNQCRNSATGGIVNIRTATRHCCANMMKQVIFSKRFFGNRTDDGGPAAEDEEHLDAVFLLHGYAHAFSISDFLPWTRNFDLDGHVKLAGEALTLVQKYHDLEIEERILRPEKCLKNKEVDLLDVLLTLKDENGKTMLTTEEIKAHIMELMLASVDNPSNAVEWALAEMILQPDMLEKARKELDTVVGMERLVEVFDIPKLNYIKACIKESFRLHPVAPFNLSHVSIKDTTICGYFIPKGSNVLLSRHGIGRNSQVWVEPLKFKPERHLKDEGSEVVLHDPGLEVFSFSTGRRGCPGVAMGSTMSTLMMARLLQGFTWTAPSDASKIRLNESMNNFFLENPLLVLAKPRLAENLYPKF